MKEPVKITDKAAEMVQEIMTTKGIPAEYRLRIGVKGGAGCFGVNYIIGFDKIKPDDALYEISGLHVLIEKKQLMFLIGVTLDYISNSEQQGFSFSRES